MQGQLTLGLVITLMIGLGRSIPFRPKTAESLAVHSHSHSLSPSLDHFQSKARARAKAKAKAKAGSTSSSARGNGPIRQPIMTKRAHLSFLRSNPRGPGILWAPQPRVPRGSLQNAHNPTNHCVTRSILRSFDHKKIRKTGKKTKKRISRNICPPICC